MLFPLLASCGAGVPTPDNCKALGKPDAVQQRCYRGDAQDEKYVGDLECWPFGQPERMQGLWLIGLETSKFWEGVLQPADITSGTRGTTWLASDLLKSDRDLAEVAQGKETRLYQVDLEGRRSLCDGMFGHFGLYKKQVVAVRFHSLQRLQ